ncbi:hypothetical protein ACFV9C_33250 [Kribbella sp. NPDC059898]|uniref:hypothetical protein n=1 Tax=Kribbella sp. NPDC059898 TaxID=3346995 RepID=UPI00365E4682
MRKLVSVAGAAGVAAGLLTVATPASAVVGVPGAVCTLRTLGISPGKQIVRREYYTNAGKATLSTVGYNPGRMTFVPRALVNEPGAGGAPYVNDHYLANYTNGYLYRVLAVGQTSYNDVQVSAKAVASGWGSIRSLNFSPSGTAGGNYLYGLADNGGFYRYVYGDTTAPHSRATIGSSGWLGVKTLDYDRTVTIPGTSRKADVFLATSSDGRLMEYTIPLDTPSKWTRRDLKTSGWNVFKSLQTEDCYVNGAASGRILIGVTPAGSAYLYHDRNARDGSAADLVAYGNFATGWTEKFSG